PVVTFGRVHLTRALVALAVGCATPDPWPIPLSTGGAPSPRFLHVAGDGLADARGAPVQLHCVNLGAWLHPEAYLLGEGSLNFLVSASELRARLADLIGAADADAFWSEYRARLVTAEDFAQLAAAGVDCVRVPLESRPLLDDPATGYAPLDDAV